ncbi:MAG: TauD/TfdA family dioxygenase [Pseudomonadota bacterium]
MRITRIAGALGAEISGFDIGERPDDASMATVREAFLEHGVILLRGQACSPDDQVAFARRFGDLIDYPFVEPLEGHPEIIPVIKLPEERANFGGLWHTDTAYLQEPPMATMLLARELPPFGGDTIFACGCAAYEALSDGLKETLGGLRCINRSGGAVVTATRAESRARSGTAAAEKEAMHPVIRMHPETGRKSLYVNPAHSACFEGMTVAESAPLLEWLFHHQIRPEFTCRIRWSIGDLALWDNRRCLHNPVNDYHGHRREMHRITIAGDKPR